MGRAGNQGGAAMDGENTGSGTESAKLAALRDYWLSRKNGRRLPGRRDIDPVDLPRHLSTVMLIDGVGDGGRYRFRLVGTLLGRLMVRDPSGGHLDQVLDGPELDALDELIAHMASHREPLAVRGHLVWSSGWTVPVEWMFLPLAADGADVDMVLACADLPSLPVRLPLGRPRFGFAWPLHSLRSPGGRVAEGPMALKRWISMVNAPGIAAPAP